MGFPGIPGLHGLGHDVVIRKNRPSVHPADDAFFFQNVQIPADGFNGNGEHFAQFLVGNLLFLQKLLFHLPMSVIFHSIPHAIAILNYSFHYIRNTDRAQVIFTEKPKNALHVLQKVPVLTAF